MSNKKKPSPKRDPISKSELEVLKVLWTEGPSTIRAVCNRLQSAGSGWAYTTVSTLLHRLQAKGYAGPKKISSKRTKKASTDKGRVPLVFEAAVSRGDLVRQRLWELADQLTDGAATPLVQTLVENNQFSAADIDTFRELLERNADGSEEPAD